MQRRFVFLLASIASVLGAQLVSCGEDAVTKPPAIAPDAALDAPLLGETAAPPLPAEDDAGNVCGDRSGLQAGAPWPLRGGCPTRAGYTALLGPQNATNPWTVPIAATESSPAVTTSGIFWVGTEAGDILCVTSFGLARWAYRTGGPVRTSGALDIDGNAVFGSTDGVLYGIAIGEGPVVPPDAGDADADADAAPPSETDSGVPPARLAFSRAIGPMSTSSPVIGRDGTIYIGTTDGKLHAIERGAKKIQWSATTNDASGSSPALGQDGTIYIASSDKKLYAFAPDGSSRFATDLGAEVRGSSPSVGGDGTIYIGTADGKLHAIDVAGKEKWAYATEGAITGTPAVYAGTVYVGSEDKKLHAVAVRDGTKRWTFDALGAVSSPAVDRDGNVYAGAADGRLYAVTPKGGLYFAVNVKGKVRSAPAMVPGPALYLTTDTGIVAVGP